MVPWVTMSMVVVPMTMVSWSVRHGVTYTLLDNVLVVSSLRRIVIPGIVFPALVTRELGNNRQDGDDANTNYDESV